jgi:hypothetical protein
MSDLFQGAIKGLAGAWAGVASALSPYPAPVPVMPVQAMVSSPSSSASSPFITPNVLGAFGSVCKAGHLAPDVYSALAQDPNAASSIGKAIVQVVDGKGMTLDTAHMPYTSGVVRDFRDKLETLLSTNPGFQSYVDTLRQNPNADPYIRLNATTGALEFGCRQAGQIEGLVHDTLNAADRQKIAGELTAAIAIQKPGPAMPWLNPDDTMHGLAPRLPAPSMQPGAVGP